jgi:hypothetical protein
MDSCKGVRSKTLPQVHKAIKFRSVQYKKACQIPAWTTVAQKGTPCGRRKVPSPTRRSVQRSIVCRSDSDMAFFYSDVHENASPQSHDLQL